ncbi:DNA mismatch repair endonuclease MutL [Fundicoccus sp. Sow4_D5]|uniref:DNA mismatch repair endonuclease MutL n=1 Tax=unclassified Fundicoccus TaxID=2761543 RepID=UPI003F9044F7
MGRIKQMSEALANQIAAGEVVERPASVVKELVENAIDANATDIVVELLEAGIQRIRVIDDGDGMDEEDIGLAFQAHATSKIYSVHDLFSIHTLGFRGEALASIASVAKVRLESSQVSDEDDATGHFVQVSGSRIVERGISKPRKGTIITVDSLFYNTPARLKHLSSIKTELRHILNFVQEIALSFPEIRFTLSNDEHKLFTSFGTGQLRQTIANVYQPALARQLLEIEASDNDFELSGFISPPQLTRTNRQYIHWIVNGRAIRSYALNNILIRAYGRRLMIGRFPVAIIRVNLDPRLVDVNVHPTKQTIRLSKEEELAKLLTQTVQEKLSSINPVPEVDLKDIPNLPKQKPRVETLPFEFRQIEKQTSFDGPTMTEKTDKKIVTQPETAINKASNESSSSDIFKVEAPVGEYDAVQQNQVEAETNENKLTKDSQQAIEKTAHLIDFKQLRYVGQIHGTYLIAESEVGFYLIDQHAAQERSRYEAFMRYDPNVLLQQQLLFPIVFNFTQAEVLQIEQMQEPFERLGIFLDAFGPTSFQLESYPNWLLQDEVEQMVYDLVELLSDQPDLTIAQIKEKTIIMKSCRGAIKANHYLDERQAKALIESMAELEDPYHCPHGRPVFIEFNQNTLEKLFKRIQDPHEGGHFR